MTQAVAILNLVKRVARVSVVAVFTASSLMLLGAVPAKEAMSRRSPAKVTAPAAARTVAVSAFANDLAAAQQASFTIRSEVATPVLEVPAPAAPATVVLPAAPAARTSRTVRMEVTAYCPCTKCCGPNAQGITASGKRVSYNDGKFVAADTSVLPFGTKLVIPGYAADQAVEVVDRGGAIKGNKLDLYFATHAEALVWGRQHLDVEVIE